MNAPCIVCGIALVIAGCDLGFEDDRPTVACAPDGPRAVFSTPGDGAVVAPPRGPIIVAFSDAITCAAEPCATVIDDAGNARTGGEAVGAYIAIDVELEAGGEYAIEIDAAAVIDACGTPAAADFRAVFRTRDATGPIARLEGDDLVPDASTLRAIVGDPESGVAEARLSLCRRLCGAECCGDPEDATLRLELGDDDCRTRECEVDIPIDAAMAPVPGRWIAVLTAVNGGRVETTRTLPIGVWLAPPGARLATPLSPTPTALDTVIVALDAIGDLFGVPYTFDATCTSDEPDTPPPMLVMGEPGVFEIATDAWFGPPAICTFRVGIGSTELARLELALPPARLGALRAEIPDDAPCGLDALDAVQIVNSGDADIEIGRLGLAIGARRGPLAAATGHDPVLPGRKAALVVSDALVANRDGCAFAPALDLRGVRLLTWAWAAADGALAVDDVVTLYDASTGITDGRLDARVLTPHAALPPAPSAGLRWRIPHAGDVRCLWDGNAPPPPGATCDAYELWSFDHREGDALVDSAGRAHALADFDRSAPIPDRVRHAPEDGAVGAGLALDVPSLAPSGAWSILQIPVADWPVDPRWPNPLDWTVRIWLSADGLPLCTPTERGLHFAAGRDAATPAEERRRFVPVPVDRLVSGTFTPFVFPMSVLFTDGVPYTPTGDAAPERLDYVQLVFEYCTGAPPFTLLVDQVELLAPPYCERRPDVCVP